MAKIIHANYVKKRLADGKIAEYPTWDMLPDTLKYSNIRQARSVYHKLASCGVVVSGRQPEGFVEFVEFSSEEVELLAREEHDEWMIERFANGWTFGVRRDAEKKQNPYLIPYPALPEDIKDYDRDAVRNILPMLQQLELRAYKKA